MKRMLEEPLVHFLVLGALIFAGYGLLNRKGEPAPELIVVSQGQLASMREAFTRTWQRPPTSDEWGALIRDRVREEVYCREAMVLGLDRDDIIIRRRLRQKMEFVFDDIAAIAEPSDTELSDYLIAHADLFRIEPRLTFRQVYLNPQKHGVNLVRDASQMLAKLNQLEAKTDASALGDSFLFEHAFVAVPASEVAKQFGDEFAAKLGEISPGQWHGPIETGFGLHLVRVDERSEGDVPELADVRDAVVREWENARRLDTNEIFYQQLLKRYTVTIEELEPVVEKKLAEAK